MTALVQKVESLPVEFNQDKLTLLTNTVCKGASQDELQLFLHVCKRTGLDPFMRQIYSIPRGGQRTIQTSIDGFRLIAERTGKYAPGKEPTYTYDDKKSVLSATAYIKKMTSDGTWHEVSATAFMSEYAVSNNQFWKRMPHVMLAKCAEAAALRKAFPAEMSGIYSDDEMGQANKTIENCEVEEVKDLTAQEIDEYISMWGEEKDNFRVFLEEQRKTREWTYKKVVEAFRINPEYTRNKFFEWMSLKAAS